MRHIDLTLNMDNFHLFTFGRGCPDTNTSSSNSAAMEVDVKSDNVVTFDRQPEISGKGQIK